LKNGLFFMVSATAITLERAFRKDLVGEVGIQPTDFEALDVPDLEELRP
jgi:hypothetical protein